MACEDLDIDEVLSAGQGLYNMMVIQEGRMTEEFHITAEAFTPMWNAAKARWLAATAFSPRKRGQDVG